MENQQFIEIDGTAVADVFAEVAAMIEARDALLPNEAASVRTWGGRRFELDEAST